MNLRAFKKKQLRARSKLIRKYGYRPGEFVLSDPADTESIYAPAYLKPKHTRNYSIGDPYVKRLIRNTPLLWVRVSYEYDEWDVYLPSDVLEQCEFDWEGAMKRMLAAGGEQ